MIGKRRIITGKVLSAKMDKSVTVQVDRKFPHPVFKKFVMRRTKIMAHDEQNQCKEGQIVSCLEIAPMSKNKKWKVINIVSNKTTEIGENE